MNHIIAIHPYKFQGLWVFDDARVELAQEPFISGADNMITRLVVGLDSPELGFTLFFSAAPFPGHQVEFEWQRRERGGNWYRSAQLAAEGWLCPALFRYFTVAPPRIFAQFKSRSATSVCWAVLS